MAEVVSWVRGSLPVSVGAALIISGGLRSAGRRLYCTRFVTTYRIALGCVSPLERGGDFLLDRIFLGVIDQGPKQVDPLKPRLIIIQ